MKQKDTERKPNDGSTAAISTSSDRPKDRVISAQDITHILVVAPSGSPFPNTNITRAVFPSLNSEMNKELRRIGNVPQLEFMISDHWPAGTLPDTQKMLAEVILALGQDVDGELFSLYLQPAKLNTPVAGLPAEFYVITAFRSRGTRKFVLGKHPPLPAIA